MNCVSINTHQIQVADSLTRRRTHGVHHVTIIREFNKQLSSSTSRNLCVSQSPRACNNQLVLNRKRISRLEIDLYVWVSNVYVQEYVRIRYTYLHLRTGDFGNPTECRFRTNYLREEMWHRLIISLVCHQIRVLYLRSLFEKANHVM